MNDTLQTRITARAPGPQSMFFGFHDTTPWSTDDSQVLLLRADPEIRRLTQPGDWADVVLWTPETDAIEVIGRTDTWNFQQGARAMWLPGPGRRVIYNRKVGDAPGAEIVSLDSGERRELPHAVGSVSPDGRYALAPNFARLGVLWPAYGYAGYAEETALVARPEDDGLWRIDLDTGERTLVFSIKALADMPGANVPDDTKLFATHVSFNREGTRIVFMVRFMSRDGALYSLIYSARPNGSEIKLIAQEKISHFDWTDEDTIVLWMRKSASGIAAARKSGVLALPFVKPLLPLARKLIGRRKGKLLNESYFTVSAATGDKAPFMAGVLGEDGHPMVSPDRRWMIVDEYPEHTEGRTPLMLVELASRTRKHIGTFIHDIGSKDTDLKCDLHPRWNRAGTHVGVDATVEGRRCFTIVNVVDLMRGS